jgi:tetratricopeptide (TPR) repeat protein
MGSIREYALSIVSVTIFCMLIIANPKVIAQDSEWVGKGDALNRQGNFSEAITAYNKALELDPNYVNAWDGKGWSLNELGNYSQAIIYLDKALEIDPKHIDALVFKSLALSNIGNQTGAKYYFDKAFETDPRSPALDRLTRSTK